MERARFLSAQIWSIARVETGNAVFIRPEGTAVALPVYISETDIQSLLVEMTHILAPRPMVHELLISAINSLHATLERVEIYGIRSGSYLCRIVISHHGKEIRLESSPSDILCLSARMDCPVHVDNDVVFNNAISVERIADLQECTGDVDEELTVREFLQKELQLAVEIEDYERAAYFRDQIRVTGAVKATRVAKVTGTDGAELE